MTYNGITGKVAIVTGAGGGIGAAVCRRLADEGAAAVAAVDRDEHAAHVAVDGLPTATAAIAADVADERDTAAYVETVLEHFGRVDLYHANAGVAGPVAPIWAIAPAEFDHTMAVNVRGCMLGLRAVTAAMLHAGTRGSIVVTASTAGLRGQAATSAYRASKHAAIGLVRCAAHDLAPHGIRINAICPGCVDTALMRGAEDAVAAATDASTEEVHQRISAGIPLGRYATPGEVAGAVVWLLSDDASYLHGEIVTISGGLAA